LGCLVSVITRSLIVSGPLLSTMARCCPHHVRLLRSQYPTCTTTLCRRRQDGRFVEKTVTVKGQRVTVRLDNRWVVPYNPALLKKFEAHINVEYCASIK